MPSKYVIDGTIDGRIEWTGRRVRRRKQLLDVLKKKERVLENERGGTRPHRVEKSIWKRLCTFGKRENRMIMMMMMMILMTF
jgi:hypothetical protein